MIGDSAGTWRTDARTADRRCLRLIAPPPGFVLCYVIPGLRGVTLGEVAVAEIQRILPTERLGPSTRGACHGKRHHDGGGVEGG